MYRRGIFIHLQASCNSNCNPHHCMYKLQQCDVHGDAFEDHLEAKNYGDLITITKEHSAVQLEDEIATLRQVLAAKEKHLVEIKQKLGINLMNELKQNFSKSWHDVQTTTAYKKTQETLTQAGQKATAAISNVGTVISKKFGDMSRYSIRHSMSMPAMRNSPTFKSFEEKVETTVTSIKTKVGGTPHPGGSFEEVLSSAANASARSPIAGSRLSETEEELHC
uniref:TPD52 like 1 n=1 Tax=Naja naja TaxID=35670 RepID=A0A8C6VJS5_NAJNA